MVKVYVLIKMNSCAKQSTLATRHKSFISDLLLLVRTVKFILPERTEWYHGNGTTFIHPTNKYMHRV